MAETLCGSGALRLAEGFGCSDSSRGRSIASGYLFTFAPPGSALMSNAAANNARV
jgi:hypothetical protein